MFAASKTSSPASEANYIESVFSTYLYTGNGSTQTITNGIDLAGKGGLVWVKERNSTGYNRLYDTIRGTSSQLYSNVTNAAGTQAELSSFNSNGFTLTSLDGNLSPQPYVSWTFREQAKFFDVVTYTGTGVVQNIPHNLGSVPGCIIVKSTTSAEWWAVQHRSLGATKTLYLNSTNAQETNATNWNNTDPTSTQFTVGTNSPTNFSGATFVAYLFAHDAGGFGLTGTDNVISCGSWVNTGSNVTVNLGYEPQYIMMKASGTTSDWYVWDTMRGLVVDGNSGTGDKALYPNLSSAEVGTFGIEPTATGFIASGGWTSTTWIYIAIRRGPMKTPTTGTSVFVPYNTTSVAAANSGSTSGSAIYNNGFVTDTVIQVDKSSTFGWYMGSRLQGPFYLKTETTAAEGTSSAIFYDSNIGAWNYTASYGVYSFRRAPGFFDVVCYTGTGSTDRTVNHNLGVAPEMMIVRIRNNYTVGVDASGNWAVYHAALGNQARVQLNLTNAVTTGTGVWFSTTPTATTFKTSADDLVNKSASGYVAYLFATCAGVSKVGSYTGTGALQTIPCGFASGARLVLIKRTDSTGDWYVWDSARGISSGNDPYLLINSTAAEVTGTNYVDTDTTGFKVTAAAPAAINANGGTFIFLAIA